MKRKWKNFCKPYMIRPIMSQVLLKLAVTLILCALWVRYCGSAWMLPSRRHAASILMALFFAQSWFSFLRLDGVKLPHFPRFKRKSGRSHTGDIADYVDTEVSSFEFLTDGEREVCTLVSALLCALFWLAGALI